MAVQTNTENGVPFYKIGTIGGKADAYISKELFDEYKMKYSFPRKGEVMITCAGTVGKCIIYNGEDSYYQDSNIVWIDNPNEILLNDFLYHLLCKVNWLHLNSTTIVRIYNDDLRNLKLYYPRHNEQKKITHFLQLINERITTQNKIIGKLQSLIKGLTNQLLIPNSNWQPTTIGQVLTINSGKDYKHLKEGNIPVYGTGGYMLSVNDYLYDGESVCIGRKGTIDKPIFLTGKFWTVDTLFYTSNFNSLLPRFGYYLFKTIDWLKYNEASGVPSLSKVSIEKIHISLPSLEIQNSICRLLDSIYDKLALEESVLNNHQTQKAFILKQMFI